MQAFDSRPLSPAGKGQSSSLLPLQGMRTHSFGGVSGGRTKRISTLPTCRGWPTEVANGFLVAERRGRLTVAETVRSLARLSALPIRIVPAASDAVWDRVLDLAREHDLTAYDAAYLELAIRERAALATLDSALRSAAHRAGVPIVGET